MATPDTGSEALSSGLFVLQASAVQERFQAAVMGCQDPLTVTTLVRLWVNARRDSLDMPMQAKGLSQP